MTTVINRTDAEPVLRELADGGHEVSTNSLMRELMARFDLTFESARDEIYDLLETGRARLTSKYTLRLPE